MSRNATTARLAPRGGAVAPLLGVLILAVLAPACARAADPVLSTAEGRALVATEPANPAGYIRGSLAAYRAGDVAGALRILEQGRELATPSCELLVALAALYVEQNRLSAAEEAAAAALAVDPSSADAHVQLGDIYASMGWRENATASYDRAVALDPVCGTAWLRKGILLTEDRHYQDAAEALVLARDRLEHPTEAFVALGRLRLAQYRYADAARFFEFALAQEPAHPRAQELLVSSLIGAEQAATAERACREFLRGRPESCELWLALGESLEQLERLQEAFAAYGQALDRDADSAAAHSRRGRLYCRFGQFDAAAHECSIALEQDPHDPLAHAYLGIACAYLGRKEEARTHALAAEAAGMRMNTVWEKLSE